MSFRKKVLAVTFEGHSYLAVQWDGSNFPSDYEEFEGVGFFEDDNGYDLESVDTDFTLEPGRKYGYVRQDDWVLKNSEGKFSHVSERFFNENFKKVVTSQEVKEAFERLDKKFPDVLPDGVK